MFVFCWLMLINFDLNTPVQEPEIAAEVAGYAITLKRVDRHLKKTLGDKPLNEIEKNVARLAAANHLIDRHIVLRKIEKETKIGDSQVAFEISKLNDRLAEVGKTLSQYLAENELQESELRYEFYWRLLWSKYLKQKMTDANLQKHFEKFRQQFDGTQMQVAHILFSKSAESVMKAESVRDEIGKGKINWSDAALKYSIATTSAGDGGEIGWINYHGPMVPEFCQHAMKLRKDEISTPLETKFGVHLIRCLAIKPGTIEFAEAKDNVQEKATRYLFNNIANKNRAAANVEIHLEDKLKNPSSSKSSS